MKKNSVYSLAAEVKREMVDAVMSVMTSNFSSIVSDLERIDVLSIRKRDGWFYWIVRNNGTQVCNTSAEVDAVCANGEDGILIKALISRNVSEDKYEIIYTKAPNMDKEEMVHNIQNFRKMNTSILSRYNEHKQKYQDAIALFRVGNFYEAVEEDARTLSETLGVILCKKASCTVCYVSFPDTHLDECLSKIIRTGFRVCLY